MVLLHYYGEGTQNIACMAWSPDGSRLASLCLSPYGDAVVHIWQSPISLATISERTHPLFAYTQESCACMDIAWSPNGTYLAISYCQQEVDGSFLKLHSMMEIWEWASQRLFCTYAEENKSERLELEDERSERYGKIAWSPDGCYLASTLLDMTIVVWEALTGKEVYRYDRHESVVALAWSGDGSVIASLERVVREIHVWNLWEWPKGRRA